MPENHITITYRPVEELIPYAGNPRDNAKAIDAVARSIRRYGVRSPILVDRDGVIIAGHTRLLAAKKLGLKEFPVVVADDLTKEQAAAFRLMDNRAQEESQWLTDVLSEEFKDLKLQGFDLTETGFTQFEVDSLTFEYEANDDLDAPGNYAYTSDDEHNMPHDPTAAGEYASVHDAADYDEPRDDDDALPYSTYNGQAAAPGAIHAGGPDLTPQPVTPGPVITTPTTFACIVCCGTPEEQDFLREIIHEPGELKNRYNMSDILGRLM